MNRYGTDVAQATPREKASALRSAVEWLAIVGGAVLAALVIKTFLLQAFYIPSASMEHTLEVRDRVLVNKLSYRLHDVNRGDIVVFERPPDEVGDIKDLIKRVVALPNETVEGRDGQVYVDGKPLPEPYLTAGTTTAPFASYTLPADQVWVMGDNRSNSKDSRVFKGIEESRIVGRAFIRMWPLTSISLL